MKGYSCIRAAVHTLSHEYFISISSSYIPIIRNCLNNTYLGGLPDFEDSKYTANTKRICLRVQE